MVFMGTVEKIERRQAILRALLEHGAPVTNIDSCRSKDQGNCAQVLLPLLEQYSKAQKK